MDTETHERTADSPTRSAEHVTELAASARRAYALIEDVGRWPLLFAPCIWSQELERTGDIQRIRLWAVVGNGVRSWTSRRVLDPAGNRIDFAQETPAAPLTEMSGHWRFQDASPGSPGRLELGHRWTTEGDPGAADRIAAALDSNSTVEIGALRSWAERPEEPDELILTFSDDELIAAPAAEVYDFLYRADLWPERLPHVAGLDLETVPAEAATAGAEVQTMDMETSAADGSKHTTQSVRLCFEGERIVYKQTTPPRGLLAHSGEWLFSSGPEGTLVTARHTVALDPAAVESVFGPGTTIAEALVKARDIIGANSRGTLRTARSHLGQGAAE
ncbi:MULTISPECIES: aromatase/cyclase [Streptomyces]|uniref:Aromatase/cyclase n=1 Tax=Streptomyces liliifuscus TaxID=2797636 RepID=A0A7T7KZJ4_9ACTN|nr:aromatase/cyclase [Streptomyces liliifuscus]QQM43701.1 aromatase/cyclase [Streptomyces liliifuscus]